jgi:hypothetical protein
MFTADGELREEFRFLEDEEPEAEPPNQAEPPPEPAISPAGPPPEQAGQPLEQAGDPTGDPNGEPWDAQGGPRFFDLVAALAEPATIYLGDQPLPGGQRGDNPEMARFYIDLLDVLRRTTEGNLPAQEAAFLEDTLYQLRVRFVQKNG